MTDEKLENRRYDAIVFDMDGTLLDTLPGLTDAVNHLRVGLGCEVLESETVREYLGRGMKNLLLDALPQTDDEEELQGRYRAFKEFYGAHGVEGTRAYPGLPELVAQLAAEDYPVAIVTNKVQEAADIQAELFFPKGIRLVCGNREGLPVKPDPTGVLETIKILGSTPERTLYIGDSEVDYATAENAGCDCVLVSWGFRGRARLEALGDVIVVDTPEELYARIDVNPA